MGSDKASLVLGGRTLLQRIVDVAELVAGEIVVVRAPAQQLPQLVSRRPLTITADPVEGEGPLAGIAAGLRATAAPVALVLACDMPFVRASLLRLLAERAEAGRRFVVPVHDGRPQPLCSALRREALAVVEAHIDAGDREVMAIARDLDAERLPPEQWLAADPESRSFENVNTPEQFEAALERDRAESHHVIRRD